MNSSVTVESELTWDGPAEFSALLLPPEDLRELLIDTPKQGFQIGITVDIARFKYKKQIEEQMLKRLEKEAKEISGAFVDATPAMRQRLNRQLEETEEKIEASQRRLEKLNNRSANEEELRQRLSVIQKQLSGWFDVTKGSLNKKMVEKLVSRIIVHKDGKIEVSLLLGNLLNYQLEGEMSKKKKNQNTLQLMFPSEKMMNENIMKVLQDVEREEQQKAIINVMNFSRNTKKNGRKTVMVNLDTQ